MEPHSLAQRRQPRHSASSTIHFPDECCSILPARLPQPMPIFLRAPPKPVISCPLKWARLINTSASMIARPIFAFSTYTPFLTGTSASSVPRSPSPMMIWQPVVVGLNPFRLAQSICSGALRRLPGYRVLQSVRKGMPPCSLTRSATTFAYWGRRNAMLPSSPKCILMATNLPSMSIFLMPAAVQSVFSFCSRLTPTFTRKSVK